MRRRRQLLRLSQETLLNQAARNRIKAIADHADGEAVADAVAAAAPHFQSRSSRILSRRAQRRRLTAAKMKKIN